MPLSQFSLNSNSECVCIAKTLQFISLQMLYIAIVLNGTHVRKKLQTRTFRLKGLSTQKQGLHAVRSLTALPGEVGKYYIQQLTAQRLETLVI